MFRIPRIPRSRSTIIGVAFLSLFVYIFSRNTGNSDNYDSWRSQLESLLDTDPFVPSDIVINEHSVNGSPYKKVLEKNPNFRDLSYHQKCEAYFKELNEGDNSWTLFTDRDIPYNKNIFEMKDTFIQNRINRYKLEHLHSVKSEEEKSKIIQDRNLYQVYENQWLKACDEAKQVEKRLTNAMSHTRIFGACYLNQFGNYNRLTSKEAKSQNIDNQCHEIEKKGFPWLVKSLPVFRRWDGTVSKGIPQISDYLNNDTPKPKNSKESRSKCFFKSYKEQLNGKGIVITANDEHISDLIRLLGNLRAVGNKLPIEVVSHGDLSKESQDKLVKIARNLDDIDLSMIDDLEDVLYQRNIQLLDPKEQPEEYKKQLKILFPPQELWFVDVSGLFKPRHREKISGAANKLVSYLFNSFKDTILIDSDVAIVSNLDKQIFQSRNYRAKGSYFFKHRELQARSDSYNLGFIRELVSSTIDTAYFGIPQTIDHVLNERYFKGNFLHFMDGGLFGIDRKRHFTSILASLQILMWEPPVKKIWSDKELVWLGFAMTGDNDFYFNDWAAGSVGTVTPKERRLLSDETSDRRDKIVAQEVCSQHAGHLSSEDNETLIWFTNGFSFCSQTEAAEQDHFTSSYTKDLKSTPHELKSFYRNHQAIEAIIIPKPEEFNIPNEHGENTKGWENIDCCSNSFWCAYDKVGGSTSEEAKGYLVNFNEQAQQRFNNYGSIHLNSEKTFDPKGKVMDVGLDHVIIIS